MAQTIKHAKTSAIPDGADAAQVQPSDWNADHQITGSVAYSEISGKPATFPATPASTTEVLTGTDATKAVTPDALAALIEHGTTVAGATTTVLGEGGYFFITGTGVSIAAITFSGMAGRTIEAVFVSAGHTLVHSANLILPGGANHVVSAGDWIIVVKEGGGGYRVRIASAGGTVIPAARASTTEVLTGTDAAKAVTADALAALWERGADLTAAAALTLGEGGFFNVNGSFGNITSIVFSVLKTGRRALLYFAGTNTIVHGTELSCPGGANLPVVAGDIVEVVYRSADRYNVSTYRRQAGGLDPAELASTTEVLTGTDATKAVTPDALAAIWEQGPSVAAASSVVLGEGGYFGLTAAAPISVNSITFATSKFGRRAWLLCDASITLVYNVSAIILPGSANYITSQGDFIEVIDVGGGIVRVASITRRDGSVIPVGRASTTEVLTGTDVNKAVTPDALAALWESIGTITTLNAGKLEIGEGGWAWLNVAGSINGVTWTPAKIGRKVTITITGGLPLLVHSNDLHLPGNADIQTVLGDRFEIVCTGGTSNRVTWYQRADGQTVSGTASTTEVLTGTNAAKTVTPDALAALWAQGTNVAAAASVVLGDGGLFLMTGSATVTSVQFALAGTSSNGRRALIYISGGPITFNESANFLVSGNSIAAVNGDILEVVQTSTGLVWATIFSNNNANIKDYLPLAGGTLTGSLTISNTGPIVLLTDTDTGADNHVSGSSVNGSFAVRADVNNEVASSQLVLGCDGVDEMTFGGGIGGARLGAPTGNFKGPGTLNAVAVYDDNVLLTCMALTEQFKRTGKFDDADLAEWDAKVPPLVQPDTIEKRPVVEEVEVEKPVKDKSGKYRMTKVRERRPKVVEHEVLNDAGEVVGKVREQATEEVTIPGYTVPRVHHTARVFKKMIDEGFKPGDPKAFIEKMRADGAMPGMPSAREWVQNQISSGEMVSRLWLSLETMGLAFEGLLKKLDEGT